MRYLTGIRAACALAVVACGVATSVSSAALIASDDAEGYGGTYGYGVNGGSGFGPTTYREGTGGGTFLETGGRRIDGNASFGIYPGGGSSTGQALDRTINNTAAFLLPNQTTARVTASVRFDLDNSNGFKGLNLKSTPGVAFDTTELLRVGLTPGTGNNGLVVDGLGAAQTLDLGTDLRGAIVDLSINLNTLTGAYTVAAQARGVGTGPTTVSGVANLIGAPGALGFANFNVGDFQNFLFDNLTVSAVPEPMSLSALAGVALIGVRRRR